jgi:hypothetical protein
MVHPHASSQGISSRWQSLSREASTAGTFPAGSQVNGSLHAATAPFHCLLSRVGLTAGLCLTGRVYFVSFYFDFALTLALFILNCAVNYQRIFSVPNVLRLYEFPPDLICPHRPCSHILRTSASMTSRPGEEPEQSQDGLVPHPNRRPRYPDITVRDNAKIMAGDHYPLVPPQTERYVASRSSGSGLTE